MHACMHVYIRVCRCANITKLGGVWGQGHICECTQMDSSKSVDVHVCTLHYHNTN